MRHGIPSDVKAADRYRQGLKRKRPGEKFPGRFQREANEKDTRYHLTKPCHGKRKRPETRILRGIFVRRSGTRNHTRMSRGMRRIRPRSVNRRKPARVCRSYRRTPCGQRGIRRLNKLRNGKYCINAKFKRRTPHKHR